MSNEPNVIVFLTASTLIFSAVLFAVFRFRAAIGERIVKNNAEATGKVYAKENFARKTHWFGWVAVTGMLFHLSLIAIVLIDTAPPALSAVLIVGRPFVIAALVSSFSAWAVTFLIGARIKHDYIKARAAFGAQPY